MNHLISEEVTLMIKLIESQRFLTNTIDGINLLDMKHKLQNIRDEADRSQGGRAGGMVTGKTLLGIPSHNLGDIQGPSVRFQLRHDYSARVPAIKLIREATGLGLKEAKDLSDTSSEQGSTWTLHLNYPEYIFERFKSCAPTSISVIKY